jgi:hypothetical protein
MPLTQRFTHLVSVGSARWPRSEGAMTREAGEVTGQARSGREPPSRPQSEDGLAYLQAGARAKGWQRRYYSIPAGSMAA